MEQETELVRSGGRSDERAEGIRLHEAKRRATTQQAADNSRRFKRHKRKRPNSKPSGLLTRRSPALPREPEYHHSAVSWFSRWRSTGFVHSCHGGWELMTARKRPMTSMSSPRHSPTTVRFGIPAKHLINRHERKQVPLDNGVGSSGFGNQCGGLNGHLQNIAMGC